MKSQSQNAPKAPSNANFLKKFLTNPTQETIALSQQRSQSGRPLSSGKAPPLTSKPGVKRVIIHTRKSSETIIGA